MAVDDAFDETSADERSSNSTVVFMNRQFLKSHGRQRHTSAITDSNSGIVRGYKNIKKLF